MSSVSMIQAWVEILFTCGSWLWSLPFWGRGRENHSLRIAPEWNCLSWLFNLEKFSVASQQHFPYGWILIFYFMTLYFVGRILICFLNWWTSFSIICVQFACNFALLIALILFFAHTSLQFLVIFTSVSRETPYYKSSHSITFSTHSISFSSDYKFTYGYIKGW